MIPAKKVCVVDERSEIAACVDGIPQNHLGERTDVIDCCPKAEGMLMVIRAMSPDIVAVDEIGGKKDIEDVYKRQAVNKAVDFGHNPKADDNKDKK